MKARKHLSLAVTAAALIGAAASGQAAGPFSLNFDGTGSVAEDFAPSFLTIGYGELVPTLDGFGDPIPGTDHWQIDLGSVSVSVIDPTTRGYGSAPSPLKALDAVDGTVLLVFDTPFSFESFTATLDNSTFGDLSDRPIEFYDAAHGLIHSESADQTIPGLVLNVGALSNVKTIVLPSTAFYDNIAVVPEPGSAVAFLGGASLLLGRRRRRA